MLREKCFEAIHPTSCGLGYTCSKCKILAMHLNYPIGAFSWYGRRSFRSVFGGVVGDLVPLSRSFRVVRDTPNSRAIFSVLGFFWAIAALQTSPKRGSSNLVYSGILVVKIASCSLMFKKRRGIVGSPQAEGRPKGTDYRQPLVLGL